VEAVARELLGCDVVPDIAVFGGLGKQVPNEVADVLLRLGDALVAMKESRELVVAVPAGLVGDEREGLEHRFEPCVGVTSLVSDLGEIGQVGADLTG
jgi:hypothetical protein